MSSKKILALIGVGSTYFTKGIVDSVIKKGGAWELRMVDIDPTCLDIAMKLGQRMVEAEEAQVTITGSTQRRDVLAGADAVVTTIGVGGRRAWEQDVYIFRQFNIFQSTGDTYGAGGVSRSMRTIPRLLEIARDMEELCPDAVLVNFTNPMTPNVTALSEHTRIKTVGLCCGVTYYQHYLAQLIGVPYEQTWSKAVGVNHYTYITDFTYQGKNAWPLVRQAAERNSKLRQDMPHTWELFDAFDAFPCVGDGHICEFIPGFQGEKAYYGKTFGIDAGHSFEHYAASWDDVFEDMRAQAYGEKPLVKIEERSSNTFRDEDYFIDVVSALLDGERCECTVNLPNRGQAPGLPMGAVLEQTTLINGAGFHPLAYDSIAPGILAHMNRIASVQTLIAEASVRCDRKMVVQALMAGLTTLRKAEAERMVDMILDTHRAWLPEYFD